MKKYFYLVIFIAPFSANAQMFKNVKDSLKALKDTIPLAHIPIDSTGAITYRVVESVNGVTKNQLYARAKVWTTLFFRSAQAVTQLDDKETGVIILKGISKEYYTYKTLGASQSIDYFLHFAVRIDVKDYKYRVILSEFQNEILPDRSLMISGATYGLENIYKDMLDWNKNAKNGAMEFNRQNDQLGGKGAVRQRFEFLNNLAATAEATIADIRKSLSLPAKSDDF